MAALAQINARRLRARQRQPDSLGCACSAYGCPWQGRVRAVHSLLSWAGQSQSCTLSAQFSKMPCSLRACDRDQDMAAAPSPPSHGLSISRVKRVARRSGQADATRRYR
eukprot:780665-Lingulodinium_polyedra.AAC.1